MDLYSCRSWVCTGHLFGMGCGWLLKIGPRFLRASALALLVSTCRILSGVLRAGFQKHLLNWLKRSILVAARDSDGCTVLFEAASSVKRGRSLPERVTLKVLT